MRRRWYRAIRARDLFSAPSGAAAEAGRELGDAGGPVLVGAFGLISLTVGLGALAATLMICAALVALRNRTSAPPPPAGAP